MKRNSGVLLIVLLLAALLVLFLMTRQADSLGLGRARQESAQTADPVQQAQNAVDAINDRLRAEEEAP